MIRRSIITVLTGMLTAGCAEMAKTTQVNGFAHKVELIDRDPPTYRAYGATRRDRTDLTNAYFARNVIAIRNVSGCPIKPELISHYEEAAVSVATVIC
ncbi:hypothetical protein [Sulfitobacter aestuariivivens]|uniref:Uncharacterized protein n=1 Tax=Sulfitobacter aestuariivivens TaxID=2766981 RepID=A0A927D7A7_9RHOB|nr:hypothetical protein [Sulfitobacter aestuariivivens]MBD3664862.1 hypothetical protein [Sulfitobacter aestuariivivens]